MGVLDVEISTIEWDIIDECTLSEWYIAQVFVKLFPNEFQYSGSKKWMVWDSTNNDWKLDTNLHQLKARMRYDLARKVMERAKYWQQKVATKEVADMHTASTMIQRLLTISQKLQMDPFVNKIIRELQEHYCG